MSQTPSRPPADPFRRLAIATILVGLVMVIGAAVFWATTGRQSSLIVGAGMTLAIGGGLRNMLMGMADRLPSYDPPPPDPPVPPVITPPTPVPPQNGTGTGG